MAPVDPAIPDHAATSAPQGEPFSWRAHPVREDASRALLGIAVVVMLAALAAAAMGSAAWGGLAILFLIAALNRFFLPSRFTIDEEGITARYPIGREHRRWSEIRRFAHDDRTGLLIGRGRSSRLARLRALAILLGREPETVAARIRSHLERVRAEGGDPSWAT